MIVDWRRVRRWGRIRRPLTWLHRPPCVSLREVLALLKATAVTGFWLRAPEDTPERSPCRKLHDTMYVDRTGDEYDKLKRHARSRDLTHEQFQRFWDKSPWMPTTRDVDEYADEIKKAEKEGKGVYPELPLDWKEMRDKARKAVQETAATTYGPAETKPPTRPTNPERTSAEAPKDPPLESVVAPKTQPPRSTDNAVAAKVEREEKLRLFLCHGAEDKEIAVSFYHELKQLGYEPWLDKIDLRVGQKWRELIPEKVRSSDLVIALLSSSSVRRRGYVHAELDLALKTALEVPDGEVFILPVRLDECKLPARLEDYHRADFFDPQSKEVLMTTLAECQAKKRELFEGRKG